MAVGAVWRYEGLGLTGKLARRSCAASGPPSPPAAGAAGKSA
jgi:hypothetical protein